MADKKPLILVVDDEEYSCRRNKEVLEEAGFEVLTDTSFVNAIVRVRGRVPGSFHAVFTDLCMYEDGSNMEGLKVADAVRAHDPAIRIVLVSSFLRVDGPFDAKISKPESSVADRQRFKTQMLAATQRI